MLDLVKLKTFLMVATTGSFKGAGVKLCYSQSNVSSHIQILEREIGAPLFNRVSTKKVILTDVGRQMMTYAHRLLALAEEAKCAVRSHEKSANPISISAPEVVIYYCLPEVLRQFQALYPQAHVSVSSRQESRKQLNEILDGTVDIAVTMDTGIQSESFSAVFLKSEELLLVGSSKYRFFPGDFTAEDFVMERVLASDGECTFLRLFERAACDNGILFPNTIELGTLEATKRCAIAGMGLAVMPKMAITQELADKRLVAVSWPGPRVAVRLQMIRNSKRWVSPATHGFWRLMEQCLAAEYQESATQAEFNMGFPADSAIV